MILDAHIGGGKRLQRIFQRHSQRIAGYFRDARDPARPVRARTGSLAKGMAALALIALALLVAYALLLIPFTPSIADLRKAKVEQPSVLMSADGKVIATFKRMNREWVGLHQVSPHVVKALIATEDHRFYEHHGIDFKRTAAGIVHTLMGDPEGGSTLTQQLARNLYPKEIGRSRSINRKLKEMITALKIEYAYSKQEILVTYLNTMPFLYNAFGIEMGARTYFDKPAAKLNVLESATLIGMLKGTSYYNPVLNPERAIKRRNVVLSQMVKRQVLSQANFDSLKKRPLKLDFERQPEPLGTAPHFAAHLRLWLIDWADRNDYNIYADGLVVHTTIDSRLQLIANQAVQRQTEALQAVADVEWGLSSERLISSSPGAYAGLRRQVKPFGHFWNSKPDMVNAFIRETGAYRQALESGTLPDVALAQLRANKDFIERLRAEKTRLQAGLVALDPATGHVKAWVGSRNFTDDQFDHVAQAKRQPGSTFKPFVYGAALEQGMSPNKRFLDSAIEIPLGDGKVWRPTDMAAPSGREITARDGLIFSKNTITAQVMQEVGAKKTISLARKMGIDQSRLEAVPALALGVSPVSLLEMVSAYGTLAASGNYHKPLLINHIDDKDGQLLEKFSSAAARAMSNQTAEELIDMLRGAINHGTGQAIRSRFGIYADVAGKTGTTQNNTDGWFILMHPRLVTGAWAGFNDARVTMRSNYWGQGGHNALLLVGDFFRQTLHGRLIDGHAQFPQPDGSVFGPILDRLDELLGRQKARPAPPVAAPPPAEEEGDVRFDDMERILNQVREAEQTFERERRRLEKTIEGPAKVIEEVRKEIDAYSGARAESERRPEPAGNPAERSSR